jgi:hypothetical protein
MYASVNLSISIKPEQQRDIHVDSVGSAGRDGPEAFGRVTVLLSRTLLLQLVNPRATSFCHISRERERTVDRGRFGCRRSEPHHAGRVSVDVQPPIFTGSVASKRPFRCRADLRVREFPEVLSFRIGAHATAPSRSSLGSCRSVHKQLRMN